MKKCLLLIALFLGLQANFAQESMTFCAVDAVDGLKNCIMGTGVQYSVVYTANNSIYIAGKGNQPAGKINSCIAQYNNAARNCADAPVLLTNPG